MTTGSYEFTDYSAIQEHIRKARIERSVAVANLIATGVHAAWRGLKALGAAAAETIAGAREVRSIDMDAFLSKPVHR